MIVPGGSARSATDSRRTPAEPARDALLRDRHGFVWAFVGGEQCGRLDGPGAMRHAEWAELLADYGPIDVLVWRGQIAVPERIEDEQGQTP